MKLEFETEEKRRRSEFYKSKGNGLIDSIKVDSFRLIPQNKQSTNLEGEIKQETEGQEPND